MTIVITAVLVVLLSAGIGAIQTKAEEPAKDNIYIASKKASVSEVTKQVEASKLAQIAAKKARQEEIDRIAIERKDTSKQAKIEENYKKAKIESDKLESISLPTLGNNQTATGVKLYVYLRFATNISSVLNRAVILHNGDLSNNCDYFSSEVMRRIGVAVPSSTANTGQYLYYLRTHAFIASYNIRELTAGSICFTKPGLHGYNPTHTFVFMGWVTTGKYDLAYVADNQGNSVHVRNMGVTAATDAFAFFMHTPTPPTAIYASSSSYNSINTSWRGVTGASGYEVYRATSSKGSYGFVSRTTSGSYRNTGLKTNSTYYYKVRAYRMAGYTRVYSGFSTSISSKPIPSLPTSVKATSSSYNSINTSWKTVDGADGYEVYAAISSKSPYIIISRTNVRSCNQIGLETNSTYYYKIRSYKKVGNLRVYSGFSTVVSSKTIPSTPTSVKGASSSYNSINISWSAVAGITRYEVYRATSNKGPFTFIAQTTAKSYNNNGLTTNTAYYYKIRAYRMLGTLKVYSICSPTICLRPVPATPVNVKATRISAKSIKTTWSNVSGANGYEVFKATSSNGTYNLLWRTESKCCTNSRLTAGKTYYYKIRSYRTVGKTRVYGDKWSAVVHAKA